MGNDANKKRETHLDFSLKLATYLATTSQRSRRKAHQYTLMDPR